MPRPRREKADFKLVRVKGRRNWYCQWSNPGSRRTQIKSTGIRVEDSADQWLADFQAMMEAPPSGATVSVLLDSYLDARTEVRTHKKMKSFARPVKAYFGARTPDQITSTLVNGYVKKRTPHLAAARRELELLTQALNHAGERVKIALPAPRPPREHFATREQIMALLGASQGHTRLYILIAMATGARKGAILDLTWDRVDEGRKVIDFTNPDLQITKKRRAPVPIPQGLVAALRDARKLAATDNVIEFGGKPIQNIRKTFMTTAKNAGLPKWFTPHVLKHSVISWLAEDGWTVDQISDYTATNAVTVKRVYRKVNPEALRGMADTLDFGALVPTPLAQTKTSKTS